MYTAPPNLTRRSKRPVLWGRTFVADKAQWTKPSRTVRRHINLNNQQPYLKEDLAHLFQDIKRRIFGIGSAGFVSFSVFHFWFTKKHCPHPKWTSVGVMIVDGCSD